MRDVVLIASLILVCLCVFAYMALTVAVLV